MLAMSAQNPIRVDYDQRAEEFARYRTVNAAVLQELLSGVSLDRESRVLDVGCGTGNYAAALTESTGCRMFGVDPSEQMLARARGAAPWESLLHARAEKLPFDDNSFDLVMSTDVIHHIDNRDAYFHEAARVLRPGGHIATVTDSHDDIPRRRPLSSHFPETVAIELRRYPPVLRLLAEMEQAGFTEPRVVEAARPYDLTDIQAYRERAFSSLLLIDDDEFQRGIERLEADLAHGPIPCISRYTIIWGTASDSARSAGG
jgi:ubiquinone/menaquinone biosynthesis C-methylase UbiE